jgi:hypothetical protein
MKISKEKSRMRDKLRKGLKMLRIQRICSAKRMITNQWSPRHWKKRKKRLFSKK